MAGKGDGDSKTFNWVWFGFIVTAIYLLVVGWVIWSAGPQSIIQIKPGLQLNEFGDAMAGMFAPLAFLWLFVATMVQSQELSLQRRELQLTRGEFAQNRVVAKEQATEARNQAEFIGTQTELFVRAEADKHLNAVLGSLKELLGNSFNTNIAVRAATGADHAIAHGLGTGDTTTLGGAVGSVSRCAHDIKGILEGAPDWSPQYKRAPLVAFRNLIGEIRALIPGISPAQKAVLEGANFGTFLTDADYLLSVLVEKG